MKQVGIIALVVILIVFGAPLLSVRDNYKNMEYEEIGNEMLANVNTYVGFLESTSNVANGAKDFIDSTLGAIDTAVDKVKKYSSSVADWVKSWFEKENGVVCEGNYEEGWSCGSSEGGGGGSFGGGNR